MKYTDRCQSSIWLSAQTQGSSISVHKCIHMTSLKFVEYRYNQDRQCKCNVISRRISATVFTVEKQYVLHILSEGVAVVI